VAARRGDPERIAELEQEIERLQRTEEAIVLAPARHASADARHGVVLGVKAIEARLSQ
jgi:hypothetical protein